LNEAMPLRGKSSLARKFILLAGLAPRPPIPPGIVAGQLLFYNRSTEGQKICYVTYIFNFSKKYAFFAVF
jgi:hypothetical protein